MTGFADTGLTAYEGRFQFWLFFIEAVPELNDWIRPICLFNRDNSMDLHSDATYFPYDSGYGELYKIRMLPLSDCGIEDYEKSCGKFICATYVSGYGFFLVNRHEGRHFLRGLYYKANSESGTNKDKFHDLLGHMQKIVDLSKGHDLFMLRRSEQVSRSAVNFPGGHFDGTLSLSHPECGRRKVVRSRRDLDSGEEAEQPGLQILGGFAARGGDDPWHAAILFGETLQCGGTLITPRVVLTAAHCIPEEGQIINVNDVMVVLGMVNRNQLKNLTANPNIQWQTPSRGVQHPDYDTTKNDVGLYIFPREFRVTSWVLPACLWGASSQDSAVNENTNIIGEVVGWGYNEKEKQPKRLQKAKMPIIPPVTCFLSRRSFFGPYLKPGQNFCVGYTNGTSTCNGDSGAGFLVRRNDRFFVRGVNSFGRNPNSVNKHKYCHPRSYTVFMDVAAYVPWIMRNLPKD